MKQNTLAERPQLLTWGVILMAAKSAFFVFLGLIGLVAIPVIFGIGAIDAHSGEAFPIILVGLLIEFIVFLLVLLQVVVLYACKRSWERARTWLIALMILAGIGVLMGGPIGIAIGVVTIIGGVQALERTSAKSEPVPA